MAHAIKDKEKLLARIRRIKGQVSAIEKALEEEDDCVELLQTVASCRGALNGLMGELIEGHVYEHVIDPALRPTAEQTRAAEKLLSVVKSYFR
ncbi:MAG: metal/formaldehyde-sensitive transcriptional repressor [Oligoflexia bacterium]|nr:metal/formaldehyde-sensitive transcriptional repressor [Oligoflexia bacterium]